MTISDDEPGGEALHRCHTNEDVIALLGHELRNPLAAIRSAIAVARLRDDAATRKWVQDVLDRQTQQMGCIIDNLMDFSRLQRGKAPLQKQRVDLAQMVDAAMEAVRPDVEERGHVLEVVLPPAPVTLAADATRLKQVLINLLANAARYTPPRGRILLTVEAKAAEVELRVRDNGVGIAPEALPHLFEPFWQSCAGGHSRCGLGLGLAVVRELVEMHGGRITANSSGPGRGSEFVVYLPGAHCTAKEEVAPFADAAKKEKANAAKMQA